MSDIWGGLTTGQTPGTATNDNASAGNVGEYIESKVLVGSAVALTTLTAKTITSISLTPGDWDVSASIWFTGAGSTTVAFLDGAISLTTNAIPTQGATDQIRLSYTGNPTIFTVQDIGQTIGPVRISTNSTISVFLTADANFGVSTCSGYGHIRARRVR